MCFEKTKFQLFKDLKKNIQIKNQFRQSFHFVHCLLFSRIFLDGIEDKAPKHQTKKQIFINYD